MIGEGVIGLTLGRRLVRRCGVFFAGQLVVRYALGKRFACELVVNGFFIVNILFGIKVQPVDILYVHRKAVAEELDGGLHDRHDGILVLVALKRFAEQVCNGFLVNGVALIVVPEQNVKNKGEHDGDEVREILFVGEGHLVGRLAADAAHGGVAIDIADLEVLQLVAGRIGDLDVGDRFQQLKDILQVDAPHGEGGQVVDVNGLRLALFDDGLGLMALHHFFQTALERLVDQTVDHGDIQLVAAEDGGQGVDQRQRTCKQVCDDRLQTAGVDEVDQLGNQADDLVDGIGKNLVDAVGQGRQQIGNEFRCVISVVFRIKVRGRKLQALAAERLQQKHKAFAVAVGAGQGDQHFVLADGRGTVEEGVMVAEEQPAEQLLGGVDQQGKTLNEVFAAVYDIGHAAAALIVGHALGKFADHGARFAHICDRLGVIRLAFLRFGIVGDLVTAFVQNVVGFAACKFRSGEFGIGGFIIIVGLGFVDLFVGGFLILIVQVRQEMITVRDCAVDRTGRKVEILPGEQIGAEQLTDKVHKLFRDGNVPDL